MRCNTFGVFAIGAVMGSAAAMAMAAMDPGMRRRMNRMALHACRCCSHKAERMFR